MPAQPYDCLGVKVEAAHPPRTSHDHRQWPDRVHTKAEQGILYATTKRLESHYPVGDFAPADTHRRRAGIKDWHAQHHCLRSCGGCGHEFGDTVRRMLTVGVHRQRVREPGTFGFKEAVEYGGTLAAVFSANEDPDGGI